MNYKKYKKKFNISIKNNNVSVVIVGYDKVGI